MVRCGILVVLTSVAVNAVAADRSAIAGLGVEAAQGELVRRGGGLPLGLEHHDHVHVAVLKPEGLGGVSGQRDAVRLRGVDAAAAVRYAFISVAVWWGGFALLTFFWVPEKRENTSAGNPAGSVVEGFRQLIGTFKKIRHLKTVLLFLSAYWFYIDGVDTIIRMAVDYGMSIGFASNDLILALLITQFVGFPSAIVFGKMGQNKLWQA